jgi:hypothetical protein
MPRGVVPEAVAPQDPMIERLDFRGEQPDGKYGRESGGLDSSAPKEETYRVRAAIQASLS